MAMERVPAGAEFLADLKAASGGVVHTAARLCGLKPDRVGRMLSGEPMPLTFLEEAERNFRHQDDGSLRLRLERMLHSSYSTRKRFLEQIWACARMVEQYRDVLAISRSTRPYYVFPPRAQLLQMHLALEELYRFFQQVCEELPDMRKTIFRQTPELRAKLMRELDDRKKAAGVHQPKLRQVRTNAESGADRGAEL